MPSWSDLGHAMRRRMGAPTSHRESVGKDMGKKFLTPEEIIASAEHANSARKYVGMSIPSSVEAVKPEKGTLIAKKNTQAAEPMYGTKANRKNVSAGNAAASERAGAKFRVVAKMPSSDPVAAPTMANAKVIKSVSGRQAPNFGDGMQSVR
jgi:ribosomal protein L17